jgi:hypothetical protein
MSARFLVWLIIGLIVYYYYIKRKNDKAQKRQYNRRHQNYNQSTDKDFRIDNVSNKAKGDLFEEFIVKKFDKFYFSILEWRSDKYIDGYYAQTNRNPDLELKFQINGFTRTFAVECKFRSDFNGTSIDIAREDQLLNYRQFERERGIKVYIALGLGGTPQNPNELFLIPLSAIRYSVNFYDKFSVYKRDVNADFYYDRKLDKLV